MIINKECYEVPQSEVVSLCEEQVIAQSVLEGLESGDEWDWE